jgi:hypothetical protein
MKIARVEKTSTLYKNKYLNAAAKARNDGVKDGCYTFEMLTALRDMAERDIYPDGRFGDEECNVWSLFHLFHVKGS